LNSNDLKVSQNIQKTKEKKLVAKPSDTFWKANEKVLDGFVKNGGK